MCVLRGTPNETALSEYMQANNIKYRKQLFDQPDDLLRAYDSRRCDALVADASALYFQRLSLTRPTDHIVLSERMSHELLAPAVRQGDDQWLNVVTFIHHAMVAAEELGITKANVHPQLSAVTPAIRRLLGTEGELGVGLGLTGDWAYRVIRHIGNYGEIFERNLGRSSGLDMERGPNALSARGGLQQSPALR